MSPAAPEPSVEELSRAHLVLLEPDTEPSDVIALYTNLMPNLPQPEDGARRLSRHTVLVGPVELDAERIGGLDLPVHDDGQPVFARAFAVIGPRDREKEPPPEWFKDADGLSRLFPQGLPDRQEGRNLDALIAVARRLHTTVRLADEPGFTRARLLTPDPAAKTMLTVYSQYWLAPDLLTERIRAVAPGADAPPPVSEEQRTALAHLIEQSEPAVLDGYAVLVPVPDSHVPSEIEVGVMVEEALPAIVAAHLSGPLIAYQVRWIQNDEVLGLTARRHRQDRAQAALEIERVAAAIMRSTAGIGVDEDGFLVAEAQLG